MKVLADIALVLLVSILLMAVLVILFGITY
jgi:hypothetical protein